MGYVVWWAVTMPDGVAHREHVAERLFVVANYSVSRAFSLTPLTVGWGLLLAVLVAAAAVNRRRRRKAAGAAGAVGAERVVLTPLPETTPGELGTVLNGCTVYEQVSATVLDLTRRGHLHLTCADTEEWELEFRAGRDSLRGYEQLLLDELNVRTGPEKYPNLTKASSKKVSAALRREVVHRGWFVDDPAKARTTACIAADTGVLLGVLTTLGLAVFTTWAVVGLGFTLGSFVALTLANRGAVRTFEGQRLAVHALALRRGLSERARDADSSYFPYAVALGVSTAFAESMDVRGTEPPNWIAIDATISAPWTALDVLALQGGGPGISATLVISPNFPA